jgi:adenylate cyclase
MIELERKFVLGERPRCLDETRSEPIEQAYLVVTDDGWELRVRRIGERFVLTIKHGSGERRLEEEVEIAQDQFESLRALSDSRLEKRRHYVDHGDVMIEVDVYAGALEGLVVAEVEFESQRQADEYEPPEWLGREVTGDERYANQRLASAGLPTEG